MSDWRERVKDIEPTNICPTCNEVAPFGAVFFIGVEGMVQECRSCRDKRNTPRTDDVRMTYSLWYGGLPDATEAFNRWLAAHDAEVTAQVEARIVGLLESDKRLHSYFYAEQFIKAGASVLPFVETHAKDCPSCDVIALIKGEQK